MEQKWLGMERLINSEGKEIYRIIDENGGMIADVYDKENANVIMHTPELVVYLALLLLIIGTDKILDGFFSRFEFFEHILKLFEKLAKIVTPKRFEEIKNDVKKHGPSGDLFVNNN